MYVSIALHNKGLVAPWYFLVEGQGLSPTRAFVVQGYGQPLDHLWINLLLPPLTLLVYIAWQKKKFIAPLKKK